MGLVCSWTSLLAMHSKVGTHVSKWVFRVFFVHPSRLLFRNFFLFSKIPQVLKWKWGGRLASILCGAHAFNSLAWSFCVSVRSVEFFLVLIPIVIHSLGRSVAAPRTARAPGLHRGSHPLASSSLCLRSLA